MLCDRVFITGGTGSLGQAIVKRAFDEDWPCQFTIYSRDEVKQSEMRQRYPSCTYRLGDVRDLNWLTLCMRNHTLVIHAAAYKQVPAAEVNAGEAIETNVIGSRNVAYAAVTANVPQVVGVSTDKACAPVNCYGETKALMEKVFQQARKWGKTEFTLVRYGNVLGSRGSVIPLWTKQAKNGYITLTDPEMTRFWLTLDDAIDLILLATNVPTGCIVIPKAPASSMRRLAEAFAPDADIKVIGLRPGEKMHEQLVHSSEAVHTEDIGLNFLIHPADEGFEGTLARGFEYRSDTTHQVSIGRLREMIYAA